MQVELDIAQVSFNFNFFKINQLQHVNKVKVIRPLGIFMAHKLETILTFGQVRSYINAA